LRLSLLTRLEVGRDPADTYRAALDMFEAADELGYDCAWVAQHHFLNGDGRLPSALPFLAALAQRTRRIGLGTAVVVLPLEVPLRVAEDAAFVDTLSGGRLQLGLGTGGDPPTFAAFSKDLESRRQRYAEQYQVLLAALAGQPLNEAGQVLYPPAPSLAERIWEATFSAEGAARIGRHGNGLLVSRNAAGSPEPADLAQLPLAEAHRRELAALGKQPRLGLSRTVYVAPDRATAAADLEEGVMLNVASLIRRGALPTGLSRDEYFQRCHIHYGASEQVIASLQADRMLPFATELVCQAGPGHPTPTQMLRSIERIAREVAPALGWRPASTG
jgi:alkanesulfonate monooxygenase SsuD/methylene tetrahydromethanopterin reductase-like flavin-dependent oxidoreductase (luciferase family)